MLALVSPVAFLIWGWGFASGLPGLSDYIPRPIGLGALSFLSLIGIYMFVRIYRVLDLSRFFARKSALMLVLPCIVLMLLKFSSFSWVVSFVVSAIMFELFNRMKIPRWLGRIALFVAPSTFAIYLLHMTSGALGMMKRLEAYLYDQIGVPVWLSYLFTAAATYVACLLIDVLRRLALRLAQHFKSLLIVNV